MAQRHAVPSHQLKVQVCRSRIYQKGGNKSGVYALGFEPVNQEEFEVFHEDVMHCTIKKVVLKAKA
jgi:hypothetical protein